MMNDFSFMTSIEFKSLNGNKDPIIYNSGISRDRDGDLNKQYITIDPAGLANYIEINMILGVRINSKSSNQIIPMV